jgi:hypothetical protein
VIFFRQESSSRLLSRTSGNRLLSSSAVTTSTDRSAARTIFSDWTRVTGFEPSLVIDQYKKYDSEKKILLLDREEEKPSWSIESVGGLIGTFDSKRFVDMAARVSRCLTPVGSA